MSSAKSSAMSAGTGPRYENGFFTTQPADTAGQAAAGNEAGYAEIVVDGFPAGRQRREGHRLDNAGTVTSTLDCPKPPDYDSARTPRIDPCPTRGSWRHRRSGYVVVEVHNAARFARDAPAVAVAGTTASRRGVTARSLDTLFRKRAIRPKITRSGRGEPAAGRAGRRVWWP